MDNIGIIQQAAQRAGASMALLPAWFTERMLSDNWYFGLLLTTGQVMCISTINKIVQAADGSLWLDVDMLDAQPTQMPAYVKPLVAPTSRLQASVNAASVVAAFELSDT